MKNNASYVYAFCLLLSDFIALTIAFIAAYILRVKVDPRPLVEIIPSREYLVTFISVLPIWLLVHAFIGLYNRSIYERRFSELGRLFIGSFIGILVVIGYNFVTNGLLFPARLVPVYGLVLGFSTLLLFRTTLRYLRTELFGFGIGINNVLLVGNNRQTKEIVNMLIDTRHTGYRIVGIVSDKQLRPGLPHFTNFQDAIRRVGKDLSSVIQTELFASSEKNNEILEFAQTHHSSYRFMPGNSELFIGNIDVELFRGLPMISVHQTALIGWGRIAKRLFDLLVSAIALVVASPILLFIALLIKATSRGPIFFRQVRLTRFNQRFKVFKFRTVKSSYNALSPEAAFTKMGKPELARVYRAGGDQLNSDPRFTSLGRVLRRLSLDELPQLLNVLIGDISLVGPRSLVPEEINQAASKHHIVSVKSGLTGLAQVSGRRDISFDERRKLDMYYVQNWSFWLDVVILLKTIRVILARTGAR